jgi:hypothetical protein
MNTIKLVFFSQVFVLLNEKIKRRNVQGKNASIFKYKKYKNVNGARNICLKIFKKQNHFVYLNSIKHTK